MNGGFSKISN
uniref:Uncharacterized protein n=1 Tax=Lepeophtheirus salmonis TaxID=72036 RepID=A0A0K2VE82_LEPSM